MTTTLAEAAAPTPPARPAFPTPAGDGTFSVARTSCTAEEWAARQQLAACYRVFHLLGWTELIYNHISLRVPDTGADKHFLINPFGLHYSEVRASNLVKVDLQGQVIGDSSYGFNAAGFAPHSALHANANGAHCVMHTHTTAGMAVACHHAVLLVAGIEMRTGRLERRLAFSDRVDVERVFAGGQPVDRNLEQHAGLALDQFDRTNVLAGLVLERGARRLGRGRHGDTGDRGNGAQQLQ